MPASPQTEFLINRLSIDTALDEAREMIELIPTLPGGKKAIKQFTKTLTPKEKKMFNKIANLLLSPFDAFNSALETACKVVYLLP